MTTTSKSLSLLYFFSGLLCGLLTGISLGKGWSDEIARFLSAAAIIVAAFFWRRIESFAQTRYLETWPVRKTRGKWHFILTEYVLIRGAVLFLVVAGPMLPTMIFTTVTSSIVLGTIVVLAMLLLYLGSETWTQCEQDYEIQSLRLAAEQSRIKSN